MPRVLASEGKTAPTTFLLAKRTQGKGEKKKLQLEAHAKVIDVLYSMSHGFTATPCPSTSLVVILNRKDRETWGRGLMITVQTV